MRPINVNIDDIRDARRRIRIHIHKTPVIRCATFDRWWNTNLFFKCENLQRCGAFKARGAVNAVLSLEPDALVGGVITHSSGNHGAALAYAARIRQVRAYVVAPENASEIKLSAVREYGGQVVRCAANQKARETAAADLMKATGAHFIHPYNDERIIAGQGTAGLEMLEQISELDVIMAPVGGGGLLSGLSLVAKHTDRPIEIVGVEPENAASAKQSLLENRLVEKNSPQTIADGLRTSLGSLTFPIIQSHVDDVFTVSEELIREAMQLIWERMKIVVEPSAAVPMAAILERPGRVAGLRVGILLSGGNVAFTQH